MRSTRFPVLFAALILSVLLVPAQAVACSYSVASALQQLLPFSELHSPPGPAQSYAPLLQSRHPVSFQESDKHSSAEKPQQRAIRQLYVRLMLSLAAAR